MMFLDGTWRRYQRAKTVHGYSLIDTISRHVRLRRKPCVRLAQAVLS
jgi:hypothetical protein